MTDEIPGNFIAMFTIGFGPITEGEGAPVGAPLLRYIADAGDNGEIDNDVEADLRDNGQLNYNHDPSVPKDDVYKGLFGDPDACQNELNLRAWCGQYYYSCEDDDTSLACQELRNQGKDLDAVFEAIASRLFTRLSR
ncbi:MAG: hypothetical protein HC922_06315 [Leptolyngbyaceae cyanobacterium SM2_3_12]|nr:hypothetical protein [Leptolyngbyaceae cyanobacterium SM2_3_12]